MLARRAGPPLLLTAVFLVITRDLLLGRAIVPWDGDEFFAPYYTLLGDFARSGRLLLWNPWNAGGMPDFVEPQVGAVSPVHLLFAAVTGGTWLGFRLFHLAILLFSGLGMYQLGRRLSAPTWGCFVVALSYVFSGFQLGHSEHLSFIYAFAWLPIQLVLWDRALERRSYLGAAQAGVVWGLSFLGGYPPVTLNNGAFCAFWAVGRCFFPHRGAGDEAGAFSPVREARTRALNALGLLTVMGAVGVAVMAPVLIGMQIEAAGFSGRVAALPRARVIGENYLGPLALTTLFTPYFAQLPPPLLWPATDLSSVSLYGGALTLTLAIWALIAEPRRPARWGLLAVAVGAGLLAVGQTLPVRGWLYDLVPPTRFFRHPAIYRAYIIAGIAVLALVGTRDLARARRRRWPLLAAALIGATGTLSAFMGVTGIVSNPALGEAQRDAALIWGTIVVAGAAFLFVKSRRGRRILVGCVAALAVFDAVCTEGLTITLMLRDPGSVALWESLEKAHQPSLELTGGLDRLPVINQAAGFGPGLTNRNFLAKKPGLLGYVALGNVFHERWSRHPILTDAASGPNRIWFASDVIRAAPSEELFGAFVQRTDALRAIPLVVHDRREMTARTPPVPPAAAVAQALATAPAAQRLPYHLIAYDPRTLAFVAEVPRDGWLLVTDRWAPGWKAWINGRPTLVSGGDFIFRALPVPAGKVEVRLHYEPATVPWLILLCWGTIAVVLLWPLAIRRRDLWLPLLARLRRRGVTPTLRRPPNPRD